MLTVGKLYLVKRPTCIWVFNKRNKDWDRLDSTIPVMYLGKKKFLYRSQIIKNLKFIKIVTRNQYSRCIAYHYDTVTMISHEFEEVKI